MNRTRIRAEEAGGLRIAVMAQLPRHAPVVVAVALRYILLWSSSSN
jgi:hypothetical protein